MGRSSSSRSVTWTRAARTPVGEVASHHENHPSPQLRQHEERPTTERALATSGPSTRANAHSSCGHSSRNARRTELLPGPLPRAGEVAGYHGFHRGPLVRRGARASARALAPPHGRPSASDALLAYPRSDDAARQTPAPFDSPRRVRRARRRGRRHRDRRGRRRAPGRRRAGFGRLAARRPCARARATQEGGSNEECPERCEGRWPRAVQVHGVLVAHASARFTPESQARPESPDRNRQVDAVAGRGYLRRTRGSPPRTPSTAAHAIHRRARLTAHTADVARSRAAHERLPR